MNLKQRKRKAVGSLLDKFIVVTFLDHCITRKDKDTSPTQCRACGFVVDETDEELIIAHWLVDNVDRETLEANWETSTILKSAIKYVEIMV